MGGVRAGVVVLVRFPFSDLSSSKLRPALVVRPGKLFTASESIVVRTVGQLTSPAHRVVVEAIIETLKESLN